MFDFLSDPARFAALKDLVDRASPTRSGPTTS